MKYILPSKTMFGNIIQKLPSYFHSDNLYEVFIAHVHVGSLVFSFGQMIVVPSICSVRGLRNNRICGVPFRVILKCIVVSKIMLRNVFPLALELETKLQSVIYLMKYLFLFSTWDH